MRFPRLARTSESAPRQPPGPRRLFCVGAVLMGTHDGAVDHGVFVVGVGGGPWSARRALATANLRFGGLGGLRTGRGIGSKMLKTDLISRFRRQPRPRPAAIFEGYEFYDNHGVLLPVVPGVISETVAASIRSGCYEESEAAELHGLIQTGEVILEIGAGCGFISTYCAKNAQVTSVYCVEANPGLIDVIRLTHRANRVAATVYHEILARGDSETDFFLNDDFWASGTHSFLGKAIRVPTTSFQARLDEIRPTMLIIDIEGGEETLFDGARLAGVKKIMVEVHQDTIGRRGVKRVFDVLAAQDFHYDMWHSARSIVTFSHVDRG
jgi:FkbM family methyltransferase